MNHIKAIRVCIVAAVITILAGSASFAGGWVGTYMTEDTKGNAFRITLADNGTAAGSKHGTELSGTWSTESDAAVIKWSTGWITTLSKDGDGYKKTVYRAGTPIDGPPTHTTGASKVE